jgi:hypothetical protein
MVTPSRKGPSQSELELTNLRLPVAAPRISPALPPPRLGSAQLVLMLRVVLPACHCLSESLSLRQSPSGCRLYRNNATGCPGLLFPQKRASDRKTKCFTRWGPGPRGVRVLTSSGSSGSPCSRAQVEVGGGREPNLKGPVYKRYLLDKYAWPGVVSALLEA